MVKSYYFVYVLLLLISCDFISDDEGISATLPPKPKTCEINNNLKQVESEGCGCSFIYTDLTNKLNGYLKFNLSVNQGSFCKEYDLSNPFTKTEVNVVFEKTIFKNFCTDTPIINMTYEDSETGKKIRITEKDGNEYTPISGKLVISIVNCKSLSLSIENAIFSYKKDTLTIPNFKSLNINFSNIPG